jgi:hypothetical protein
MLYELIPWMHSPRAVGGTVDGERVPAPDAKAAARFAVKRIRESQGGVRKVHVVRTGAHVYADPLMVCGGGRRSDAVAAREVRIARERRGLHNVVRCEVISPAFKRELAKKPKKPKRKKR